LSFFLTSFFSGRRGEKKEKERLGVESKGGKKGREEGKVIPLYVSITSVLRGQKEKGKKEKKGRACTFCKGRGRNSSAFSIT